MKPTLEEVNHIMQAFRDDTRFEYRKRRLYVVTRYGSRAAINGSTGWYPRHRFGSIGMGSTQELATMQLAHWLRDEPRVPISTWQYWCGPGVMLASQDLIDHLKASSYDEKTSCVLCGSSEIGDWWSRDGLNGPACGWKTGCRQKAP